MENPFFYGTTVSGKSFTNRQKEIKEIVGDLKSGQNLFIYSPRRYGKTSLIKVVLEKLKKERFATIYLDFYQIYSKERFIDLYSRAIANAVNSKIEKLIDFFKRNVRNVIPSITIEEDGKPKLQLEYSNRKGNIYKLLEDVYQLPQKLAVEKKKKVVVVFDEFQEAKNLNGDQFGKELRANIQHHEKISYVFMGSKTHILLNMFNDKNSAFYKIGKMIYLNKLPKKDLVSFILKRFREGSYKISVDTTEEICNITKNHPYYVQMICHEIWEICSDNKEVEKRDLNIASDRIIKNQSELYLRIWDSLSIHQKELLIALINSGGESIFSKAYRENNKLPIASTVNKCISALIAKEIVEKNKGIYEVPDMFFAKWLENNIV
ncbi:ATP-binding protein [candidate division WOR-3 bacterium]|nr:ATP-binding protein [candidate division WOR-3 bacterium]